MRKVRIVSAPMQSGGITPEQRDAWERMQSGAYQQGFYGDNHSRQPGVDFMKSYGVDPAMLPAYQQDLLNQRNVNPWNRETASTASRGYSPVDNFYGDKTSRERYVQYQVQLPGQAPKSFGTNWQAATDFSNKYDAERKAPPPPQWQSNDQGIPMPVASAPAPTYSKQNQQGNWHTNENTDYSIDSVRSAKFGGVMNKRKVKILSAPEGAPQMSLGGTTYVPGGPGGYGNQQKGHGYALDPQRMQKGGKTNPPIYVDSPNDPRYRSYQDSLALNKLSVAAASKMGFKESEHNEPYVGNPKETFKTYGSLYSFTDPSTMGRVDDIYKRTGYKPSGYFPIEGELPYFKKPVQPIIAGQQLQHLPYSWEMQSQPEFHPQPMQVPNLPPFKIPESGWYSNDKLVPIDASDEEVEDKLYNPDGSRKYKMGGNSSNFEAGREYDLHPSHVQELMNQGYDITIL